MGKASLWRIPADHFRTLYDDRTGKPDWLAWSAQTLVPIAIGVVSGVMGATLREVGGAVAGVSIVAGLLFAMSIFLFQLRTTLGQDKRLTAADFRLVDECMANTLWAIVWGLAFTLYLVVMGAGGWMYVGPTRTTWTGVAITAGTHFLIVIMMCLKRLRRAYERIAMKRP
ncbi:hypothetical protein [Dermabacter hominis]|uniref:hypothetical protein n=1 Tax=Dermabacter hominis TaxID=36740 RepID=UPI00223BD50D|nr:hypothetical protein [Dermabacter hominis]MCT2025419.1 hypothetical protein [Dermabacter hominis]